MFEPGNVVKFRNGVQTFFLWGDTVFAEYFLVKEDQGVESDDFVKVYVHPYTLELEKKDLELVVEDEFDDFPDDFEAGWEWWDSLTDEDKEDCTGPNWIEYLGR